MKFAFVDTDGQVMAYQASPNPPSETAWESVHGYTRVEVPNGVAVDRDVIVTTREVVAIPAVAAIPAVEAVAEVLDDDGVVLTEAVEAVPSIKARAAVMKTEVATVSASVNPVQPQVSARDARIAELQELVRTDSDTPDEFRELYKLTNGLA